MMARMTWAAVPVKSLGAAKQRLAPVLTLKQRRVLVMAMLHDVLDALAGTALVHGIMVISPDADVLLAAASAGAVCIPQSGDIGFAPSADEAARVATLYRADAVMVVPADIPAATHGDFTAVIGAHAAPGCTIVPSWDELGSNCVVLSPPSLLSFQFGQGSFRRHVAAAASVGIAARVVRNGRLSHDIDEPGDLTLMAGASCGPHVRDFLQSLFPAATPVVFSCSQQPA